MIPYRIALIGFMASGKTCIGEKLASRLGYNAGDTDCMVETSAGMTISEIFELEGEEGFRSREEAALALAAELPTSKGKGAIVLSCGGGIVLSSINRKVLIENFFSIWLDVPFDEILRRLEGQRSTRPLLAGEKFEEKARSMYLLRNDLYNSCSRLRYAWSEGESIESTVDRLIASLENSSWKDETGR
jgi:shikimate kinase